MLQVTALVAALVAMVSGEAPLLYVDEEGLPVTCRMSRDEGPLVGFEEETCQGRGVWTWREYCPAAPSRAPTMMVTPLPTKAPTLNATNGTITPSTEAPSSGELEPCVEEQVFPAMYCASTQGPYVPKVPPNTGDSSLSRNYTRWCPVLGSYDRSDPNTNGFWLYCNCSAAAHVPRIGELTAEQRASGRIGSAWNSTIPQRRKTRDMILEERSSITRCAQEVYRFEGENYNSTCIPYDFNDDSDGMLRGMVELFKKELEVDITGWCPTLIENNVFVRGGPCTNTWVERDVSNGLSESPTFTPSSTPTLTPTAAPSIPTFAPSRSPTVPPTTKRPTLSPTRAPTMAPTRPRYPGIAVRFLVGIDGGSIDFEGRRSLVIEKEVDDIEEAILRRMRCLMRNIMSNVTLQESVVNANQPVDILSDQRIKNEAFDLDGSQFVPSLELDNNTCVEVDEEYLRLPENVSIPSVICLASMNVVVDSVASVNIVPTLPPVSQPPSLPPTPFPTRTPSVEVVEAESVHNLRRGLQDDGENETDASGNFSTPQPSTREPTTVPTAFPITRPPTNAPTLQPTLQPTILQITTLEFLELLFENEDSVLYRTNVPADSGALVMTQSWLGNFYIDFFTEITNSTNLISFNELAIEIPDRDAETTDDALEVSCPVVRLSTGSPSSSPTLTPQVRGGENLDSAVIAGISVGTVVIALFFCCCFGLCCWRLQSEDGDKDANKSDSEKALVENPASPSRGLLRVLKSSDRTVSQASSSDVRDRTPKKEGGFRLLESRTTSDGSGLRLSYAGSSTGTHVSDMDGLRIELEQLTLGPLIGVGGRGRIFKATYCGSEVAVKELFPLNEVNGGKNAGGRLSRKSSAATGRSLKSSARHSSSGTTASSRSASASTEHAEIGKAADTILEEEEEERGTKNIQNLGHSTDELQTRELDEEPNFEDDEVLVEVRNLRRLRHPNIIQLYGCTEALSSDTGGYRFFVVMELAACSLLDLVLRTGKSQNLAFTKFDFSRKLMMSRQIAAGLGYIHDNNMIHFDVKSENVLLDVAGNAKICDLGIAKFTLGKNIKVQASSTGTPAFMAPELLRENTGITSKVDVYSYALVLWQVFYEAPTHPRGWTIPKLFYEVRYNHHRPALEPARGVDPVIIDLIQRCWAEDPDQRPPFDDIIKELDAVLGARSVSTEILSKANFRIGDSVGVWDYHDKRYVPATVIALNDAAGSADVQLKADGRLCKDVPQVELIVKDLAQDPSANQDPFHSVSGLAIFNAGTRRRGGLALNIPVGTGPNGDMKINVSEDLGDMPANSGETFVFSKNQLQMQGFLVTEGGVSATIDESPSASSSESAVKQDLFRYRELGRGVSGAVHGAINIRTFKLCAVKEVKFTDRSARHQAARELKALHNKLGGIGDKNACPYIVWLLDAFLDTQTQSVCLVMELMDGGSLQDLLNRVQNVPNGPHGNGNLSKVKLMAASAKRAFKSLRSRPSSNDDASTVTSHSSDVSPPSSPAIRPSKRKYMVRGVIHEATLMLIAHSVLSGLAYLHEHHFVHLDIKPANILINSRGHVKLADFGLARQLETAGEHFATTFVGTMKYMSPERLRGGNYAYPSDIWSFGLTLLTILFGHFPMELLQQDVGVATSPVMTTSHDNNQNKQVKSKDGRLVSRSSAASSASGGELEGQGSAAYWQLLERFDNEKPIIVPEEMVYCPPLPEQEDPQVITVSKDFRDFIQRCLELDPAKRLSAKGLLQHPWMRFDDTQKVRGDDQLVLANAESSRATLQDVSFGIMAKARNDPSFRSRLVQPDTDDNEKRLQSLADELLLPVEVVRHSFSVAAKGNGGISFP